MICLRQPKVKPVHFVLHWYRFPPPEGITAGSAYIRDAYVRYQFRFLRGSDFFLVVLGFGVLSLL